MAISTSLLGNSYSNGLTSSSTATQGVSNYNQTGILSVTGNSYAYAPGSDMTQFLDGINSTTAQACLSPNGAQDVMAWANNLAQQAANTSSSSASSITSTSNNSSASQLFSSLINLLGMMTGNSVTSGIYNYYNTSEE